MKFYNETFSLFTRGLKRSSPGPAWNGAWRRMFGSKTESLALDKVARRSVLFQLPTRLHHQPSVTLGRVGYRNIPLGESRRGFRFSAWRRNEGNAQKPKSLSLSERMKKLSREYGWSAVGVYLALSVLDFPFCFLLVRIVGVDTIGRIEHSIVSTAKSFVPDSVRDKWRSYWGSVKEAEVQELGNDEITEKVEMVGWGVEQAQEAHQENASIWTQLALAYAIHKSFIFLRVPLTAAVTPKVVKTLRSWGWNIGKRTPKSPSAPRS